MDSRFDQSRCVYSWRNQSLGSFRQPAIAVILRICCVAAAFFSGAASLGFCRRAGGASPTADESRTLRGIDLEVIATSRRQFPDRPGHSRGVFGNGVPDQQWVAAGVETRGQLQTTTHRILRSDFGPWREPGHAVRYRDEYRIAFPVCPTLPETCDGS